MSANFLWHSRQSFCLKPFCADACAGTSATASASAAHHSVTHVLMVLVTAVSSLGGIRQLPIRVMNTSTLRSFRSFPAHSSMALPRLSR